MSTIEDSQDTDSSLTPSPHKIHSISDFLDRNISTKGSGAPPPESPYMVPNTYPPAGSHRGLKKPTQSRLPQSQEVTELKSSLARIKKLNHRYINVANENLELKVDIELYRKELRQCKEELDAMQKKAENAIARSLFYQKLYFKSEASHNPGMPEYSYSSDSQSESIPDEYCTPEPPNGAEFTTSSVFIQEDGSLLAH